MGADGIAQVDVLLVRCVLVIAETVAFLRSAIFESLEVSSSEQVVSNTCDAGMLRDLNKLQFGAQGSALHAP
jgi:hypothetical protein